jgi:hypothetical protein
MFLFLQPRVSESNKDHGGGNGGNDDGDREQGLLAGHGQEEQLFLSYAP